jgi:hypothetical protein
MQEEMAEQGGAETPAGAIGTRKGPEGGKNAEILETEELNGAILS